MRSLTRFVLAHKRIVVIGWIALTIAGIAASGAATERLTNDSSIPDTEGWETTIAIAERYNGSGRPLLPVVTLPAGTTVDSPGVKAELAAVDARLRRALPQSRIASFASTGSRAFVSRDGRTVFALAYPGRRRSPTGARTRRLPRRRPGCSRASRWRASRCG